MYLSEFESAVRDWLGDPPREVIDTLRIRFFILSAFDLYAGQMINARKTQIPYKQTFTTSTIETLFALTFPSQQISYARRRFIDTDTQDFWSDIDVAENIETLNEAANKGIYAVFVEPSGSTNKVHLSWQPTNTETIEFWGSFNPFGETFKAKILDATAYDANVTEIPEHFNHLVIETASRNASSYLFKVPNLREFAQATRETLSLSISQREVIWHNWLAGSPDAKRKHRTRAYTPLNDPFYAEDF